MRKQVPLVVVNTSFLNQTVAFPDTVLFTSENGGFYLVTVRQEVANPNNDNITPLLKYSDGVQDFEIDLGGSPGPAVLVAAYVEAGSNLVLGSTNVVINPSGSFSLFVSIVEL